MHVVKLLVCGEALRGDDGVAAAIVDALPAETAAMTRVRAVGQLMPDDLLGDGAPVIVIDAVEGPPVGEVIDLELPAIAARETGDFVPSSCHALPLAIVVGIANQLRASPLRGRFVGIAGKDWEMGAALSPDVAISVPEAAERVALWVRRLGQDGRGGRCA